MSTRNVPGIRKIKSVKAVLAVDREPAAELVRDRSVRHYVWSVLSLALTFALLIAVAYPGLKTVAEELAENNGGGLRFLGR